MECGSSRKVTIQLVDEEAGPGARGPQPFRGQVYEAIRAACLDSGILFRDPCFPAGPDALGYDILGPDSEKAKGVEWKRPHVKWGWGRTPGRRLGPGPLGLREEAGAWTPGSEGGGPGPGPLGLRAGPAIRDSGRPREAELGSGTCWVVLVRGPVTLEQGRAGGDAASELPAVPPSGAEVWPPPQEFCAEPQFICEDMSRTDVCQGSLGETPLRPRPGPVLASRPAPPSPLPVPPHPASPQVTAGSWPPPPPSLCTPDSCAAWSPLDRVSKMATQVSSTSR
ncbi:Hypothetical predicted protein [Marmota monax]|uniref:Calpain catalytic domain-containing protein n=1 Tax=Marmota monax TaxID=9995 RepID=A0A5E4AFT2_MARMO|nr:Hypothetical predicted protein [Marmota monax]